MADEAPGDPVNEATVRRLAALVGLQIADEQLPGVVENLQRTFQIAQALTALPLAPEQEAAPIWRP